MKRTVTDWEAAVCKHRGLPARAGMIALWLARRMKPSRVVSVSEDGIAESFGVSRTTVTNSIKQLKEAGLLVNIVAGRKGMTAVYQGMFPSIDRITPHTAVGMTDAARDALARVSGGSAQRPDVVDTETTYKRPDVVDAIHGVSVQTSWTPRTTQSTGQEGDQPWSGQEQAWDGLHDVRDDRDTVSLQGAKRPASPEAQRQVSDAVKAALDDWGVTETHALGTTATPAVVDVDAKPQRSGGRAA